MGQRVTSLPIQLAPAAAWLIQDYRRTVVTSSPAAGGIAQAQLPQVPQDELWLVERIVVRCTSAATTAARLYLDQITDANILDGSRSGNFDVADQGSPIQVPGGSVLLCQWTGADNGAIATLRVQIVVLKQA